MTMIPINNIKSLCLKIKGHWIHFSKKNKHFNLMNLDSRKTARIMISLKMIFDPKKNLKDKKFRMRNEEF